MRMFLIAAAIFAATTMSASAQTIAQQAGPLFDQLRGQIGYRESNAPANEGNQLLNAELATLRNGEERTTHIVSDWTGQMTITGFCGASCADLDLTIIDTTTNTEVVTDTATNATPIVNFWAQNGHDYSLKVTMYSCSDTCLYITASYFRIQ